MKVLLALLFSVNAYSAQIEMSEKNYPIGTNEVEHAIVQGEAITLRSFIKPCAHYPGYPDKVFGDVYECLTSRSKLQSILKDNSILTLPDTELSQALKASSATFFCNEKSDPVLMKYKGKNVYIFSGAVLRVK